MRIKEILEAANAAQQAAIAINMKKHGKKPKKETDEAKQRLDPKCWKGHHKEGTKMKGGIRVNNCVPNESVEEASNSTVDMTGKKCEKCKKGTYQETGMHDDMDGVLHCTKCGTEVKRHPQRHRNIRAKVRHESVDEASGHIPKNKEEANDPRWSNALTVDIGPGEDKKQAAKFGFKVSSSGPPKMRADGKF